MVTTTSWLCRVWGAIALPRAATFRAALVLVAVLVAVLGGALAPSALADESGPAINKMCPVTEDEPVDPNHWVMHEGRKIGLCCKKCKTRFLADPASYMANLPPVQEGQPNAAPKAHADAASDEHDHATDHGAPEERSRLLVILGRAHVMVVHFPVALLMLAAFLELASLRSRWRSAANGVRPLIGFGAIAAIAAAGLGLIHALGADYRGDLADYFVWHRALGLVVVATSIIAWYLLERRRRDASPGNVRAARIAVVSLGVLVGVAGHLGGALVFGPDFLIP